MIAYLLIAALAAGALLAFFYVRYHSQRRTGIRARRRETARYEQVMADKAAQFDGAE